MEKRGDPQVFRGGGGDVKLFVLTSTILTVAVLLLFGLKIGQSDLVCKVADTSFYIQSGRYIYGRDKTGFKSEPDIQVHLNYYIHEMS